MSEDYDEFINQPVEEVCKEVLHPGVVALICFALLSIGVFFLCGWFDSKPVEGKIVCTGTVCKAECN